MTGKNDGKFWFWKKLWWENFGKILIGKLLLQKSFADFLSSFPTTQMGDVPSAQPMIENRLCYNGPPSQRSCHLISWCFQTKSWQSSPSLYAAWNTLPLWVWCSDRQEMCRVQYPRVWWLFFWPFRGSMPTIDRRRCLSSMGSSFRACTLVWTRFSKGRGKGTPGKNDGKMMGKNRNHFPPFFSPRHFCPDCRVPCLQRLSKNRWWQMTSFEPHPRGQNFHPGMAGNFFRISSGKIFNVSYVKTLLPFRACAIFGEVVSDAGRCALIS